MSYYSPHDTPRGSNCLVWLGSWNLGGVKSVRNLSVNVKIWLGHALDRMPDLIVMQFQEFHLLGSIQSYIPSSLKTLTGASQVARESSFDKSIESLLDFAYEKAGSSTLVGLRTILYVKRDTEYEHVSFRSVKLGHKRMVGNKGALLLSLTYACKSFAFVNVHLAHGDARHKLRRDQLQVVLDRLKSLKESDSEESGSSAFGTHDFVFLSGDFNFRNMASNPEEVKEATYTGDLDYFWSNDELNVIGLHQTHVLEGFVEVQHFKCKSTPAEDPPFPPTYKYLPQSSMFDPNRYPAWTDRMLAFRPPSVTGEIRCLSYESDLRLQISDHRPISSLLTVQLCNHSL